MNKYRIVQLEYANGGHSYVLEKEQADGTWKSIVANKDLDFIRDVRKEREAKDILSTKVIE